MSLETFNCPQCQALLRRSANLRPGVQVKCPRCLFQFAVPPEDCADEEEVIDLPLERIPDEETAEERPNRLFSDQRRPRPRLRKTDLDDEDAPPRRGPGLKSLDPTNYEVNIGRWWSSASSRYGDFVAPAIGFNLLLSLINLGANLLPILGPLIVLFGLIPLPFGPQIAALRLFQRGRCDFNDFFAGYTWYGSFLVFVLVGVLVTFVCLLPLGLSAIAVAILNQGRRAPGPELAVVIISCTLLSLGLLIYLATRYFTFAPFLIIDRNYGPIEAMSGSWRLTRGHVLHLIGLGILMGLFNLVGLLACFIGLLFTVPQTTLLYTSAYLDAVGVDLQRQWRDDPEPRGAFRRSREEERDVYRDDY